MNYVLSDECAHAVAIVKDICNNSPDVESPLVRDIIDIYALANNTLIVADDHVVFRAVYNVIESFALVPKTDEYVAFTMARYVVNELRQHTRKQVYSAFTHHAKLAAVFNGSSTFGTLKD